MNKYLLILVCTILFSCSDIVISEYDSFYEAESDLIFERGWLPEIIPSSAYQIETENDLDENTSEGSFMYKGSISSFTSRLIKYEDELNLLIEDGYFFDLDEKDGISMYVYRNDRSEWIFIINSLQRKIEYSMVATSTSNN
jgi:hypothetical protein